MIIRSFRVVPFRISRLGKSVVHVRWTSGSPKQETHIYKEVHIHFLTVILPYHPTIFRYEG